RRHTRSKRDWSSDVCSSDLSGVVSSLFYLAYCFTVVLATVFTTREGPRRMILLAGLSAFIGLLLIGVTPNVWVLILGVLLAGARSEERRVGKEWGTGWWR